MIAKTWKQPKCPSTDERIKKMWCIYNGISLSYKKNEIMQFAVTMDGPRDYQIKWSKSLRERQIPYMISLICGI